MTDRSCELLALSSRVDKSLTSLVSGPTRRFLKATHFRMEIGRQPKRVEVELRARTCERGFSRRDDCGTAQIAVEAAAKGKGSFAPGPKKTRFTPELQRAVETQLKTVKADQAEMTVYFASHAVVLRVWELCRESKDGDKVERKNWSRVTVCCRLHGTRINAPKRLTTTPVGVVCRNRKLDGQSNREPFAAKNPQRRA